MRKLFTNLKLLIMLCFLFFGTLAVHSQEVTDPSTDFGYDADKAAQVGGGFKPVYDEGQQRSAAEFESFMENNSTRSSSCFIPVDGSYTAIPRNDDGSYGPVALPFTFSLYGSSYNQIYINTNGNITFTGPVYAYSASGFPFSTPMVAPFWGDVHTSSGGAIYFKVNPTNVIVTWNGVGYYYNHAEKLNTFQAILGTYADELTGVGQNVSLRYGDMQWTTGDASSGANGFGGVPATVGINEGNGSSNYIQIGRFNQNNSNYDGPGGNYDGINYMDDQCISFNVSSAGNIPPSFAGLPSNNTIDLSCGDVANYSITAIAPEVNQNVTISVNTGGLCNTTATVSGSTVSLSVIADNCNEGSHVISLTATDNGNPSESSIVELIVNVTNCCVPPSVVCPENVSVVNDEGQCGAIVSYADAAVSGSSPAVSYSHPSGSFFPVGITEVFVTADNACGSSACSFSVEVLDVSSPELSFPPTYVVSSEIGQCGASISYEATATDNCSAVITYSHPSGSFFPVGNTTVTATATDPTGNTVSATSVITVVDDVLPVLSGVIDVNVSADMELCGAFVSMDVQATDNCIVPGQALNFDGQNDYVSGPVNVVPMNGEFSISVWAKNDIFYYNSFRNIYAQGRNLYLGYSNTGIIRVGDSWGNTGVQFPTDNQWHHYVVVNESNNAHLYIDGALMASKGSKIPASPTNWPHNFLVGSQWSTGERYSGNIDEIQVWGKALNQEEIACYMNMPLVGNEADLVAYYNFEDGSGSSILSDQVSAANNATLVNMNVNTDWVSSEQPLNSVNLTNSFNNSCDGSGFYPVGTTQVVWTATDAAGNTTVETQSVAVIDDINPVLVGVPSDIVVSCDVVPEPAAVTATDNCSADVTFVEFQSPANAPNDGLEAYWSFNEGTGNTSDDLTGNGSTAGLSSNVNWDNGHDQSGVAFAGTGNDYVQIPNSPGGPLDTQYSLSMFASFYPGTNGSKQMPIIQYNPNGWGCHLWQVGPNTLFVRFTNRSGGFTNALAANVLTPGEWQCVGATYDYETGMAKLWHDGVEVASQNIGQMTLSTQYPVRIGSVNFDSRRTNGKVDEVRIYDRAITAEEIGTMCPDCPQHYYLTRTWTATDPSGNSTSASQVIEVQDITPPVIDAMPNLTVSSLSDLCGNQVDYLATATDNCGNVTLDYSIQPGSFFSVGSHLVTVSAEDECGNQTEITFNVEVIDDVLPLITSPEDVFVSTDAGLCEALNVDLGIAIASDNCSFELTNDAPSVFPHGETVVTWSVIDASGNSAVSQQIVTVSDDEEATVLTQDAVIYLDANGAASIDVSMIDDGTYDNCGIASLSLSQELFGCEHVGTNTVVLTAVDVHGNESSSTASVVVYDEVSPVAICQSVTVTLSGGMASVTPEMIDDGSNDACGIASLGLDITSFDCSDIGDNMVELTVTDNNGNVSTCESVVTVVGEIPSCSIDVDLANDTYTGGDGFTLFLGYGPQSLMVSSVAQGGGPFTYEWSGGNGFLSSTGSANPVFSPTEDGIYTLTCLVTNSFGCETICDVEICVKDIRAGGNGNNQKVYICHVPKGNPNNAKTLKVSVNAVPAHLSNHGGDALGYCGQECGDFKIDIESADLDEEHAPELSVYPNPTLNTFNVILDSHSPEDVNIEVFDHLGKKVISLQNLDANSLIELGENLAPGFYYINVVQGEFTENIKVVKSN